MERKHLEAYLGRDWRRVAAAKDEHWRRRKARLGAAAALRASTELRDHARLTRPAWPTDEDREEDLQAHRRVAEALRRTRPIRGR